MAFLSGLLHKNKRAAWGLTTLGKQKAETASATGPKFDILSTLSEHGPSTASELSDETHIEVGRVNRILNGLKDNGYVQETAGGK